MLTYTVEESSSGPIILWGMYPHRGDERDHIKKLLSECVDEMSYTLIAFQVSDWNREFSLWKSDALDESFSGGAKETLRYLLEELIPDVRAKYGAQRKLYVMGYSLAGLFALWCLYQTDVLDGAASCSGSLWYPDFVSYMEKQETPVGKRIYLSLGGKEANTGNALMSTIEDCTQRAVKILQSGNNVKYERNPGGHFADSGKRLVKAIKYLVQ